jgi:hypothetical protein
MYKASCYRNFFFPIIFEKYGKYFKKFSDYILTLKPEEISSYILSVENFARDAVYDKEGNELPIKERDLILVFGAMLNIESTFLTYDKDNNNNLNYNELMNAFKTYEQSILFIAKAKTCIEVEKFVKPIYLYLVKYEEMPAGLKFLAFYIFGKEKSIIAYRKNIGKILYYLAMESRKPPVADNKCSGAQ